MYINYIDLQKKKTHDNNSNSTPTVATMQPTREYIHICIHVYGRTYVYVLRTYRDDNELTTILTNYALSTIQRCNISRFVRPDFA